MLLLHTALLLLKEIQDFISITASNWCPEWHYINDYWTIVAEQDAKLATADVNFIIRFILQVPFTGFSQDYMIFYDFMKINMIKTLLLNIVTIVWKIIECFLIAAY